MGKVHKENPNRSIKDSHKHVNNFNRLKHNVRLNAHDSSKAPVCSNAHVRLLHKLDSINCLYTNADCLTNKMSELRLYAKNNNPKIIGITEVKPKNFRNNIQNCELAIEN